MEPTSIIFNSKTKNTRSVCSSCGTFFSDGDNIIICPRDKSPSHLNCWQKNKGCKKCNFKDKSLTGNSVKEIIKAFFLFFIGLIILLTVSSVIFIFIILKDSQVNLSPSKEPTKISLQKIQTPLNPSPSVTEEEEFPINLSPSALEEEELPEKEPTINISQNPSPLPSPEPTANLEELSPFEADETVEEPTITPDITDINKKAVEIAMAQIGKPYVWETTGPDTFDCAGLCSYSYWMASEKTWQDWNGLFYVSDLLKLCTLHKNFAEIKPGDLVVRKNYLYLKPFEIRNETGPDYDIYDTEAEGWPYGLSPVHDYGHIGIYAGEVEYKGIYYRNAVIEARGRDWGVVICELDRDGDGQMEWGNFFYRPIEK